MLPKIVEYQEFIVPLGAFFLGFFTSRFTLSKVDRISNENVKFALSREFAEGQNQAYAALMSALTKYAQGESKPSLDDFFEISRPAQNYLFQQKLVADAIMSDKIDRQSRDATFIPKLTDTADRLIPKIHDTLREIAVKHSLPYPADFQRGDYQSVFDAVEKYGRSNPLKMPAANSQPSGDSGETP